MSLVDVLKKSFGLSDDATEDDVAQKLSERITPPGNGNNGNNGGDPTLEGLDAVIKGLREQDEAAQLEKMNDVVKTLREHNDKLEASLRLSEANAAVQQLSEGKGYVLPVPAQEKLLQLLIKSPKPLADDIIKLFAEVKEKGLVELGERGRTDTDFELQHIDDPVQQFNIGVQRRMAENQLSYADAVRQLSRDNPSLYTAYRNATFIEGEVK
jgi:hypothetical protein